jgi:hypothetical protein
MLRRLKNKAGADTFRVRFQNQLTRLGAGRKMAGLIGLPHRVGGLVALHCIGLGPRGFMPDSERRGRKFTKTLERPNLAAVLSRVARGEENIVWAIPPGEADRALCEASIRALIESGGKQEGVSRQVPGLKIARSKFRKMILRHLDETYQTYFKVFLPDLSLTWRRGLKCFMPPALREARAMQMTQGFGIDTVELVGVATLPWASRLGIVQDISVLITRSPIETQPICLLIDKEQLSIEQRFDIARRVLEYAELFHAHYISNMDALNDSNVLFNPTTEQVLLCDLERTRPLPPGRFKRRVQAAKEMRKMWGTLEVLLGARPPRAHQCP